jgi:hypothetical protein
MSHRPWLADFIRFAVLAFNLEKFQSALWHSGFCPTFNSMWFQQQNACGPWEEEDRRTFTKAHVAKHAVQA